MAVWSHNRFCSARLQSWGVDKNNLFFKSSSNRVIAFDQIGGVHTINSNGSGDESASYQRLKLVLVNAERVLFMDCGREDLKNIRRVEHILR